MNLLAKAGPVVGGLLMMLMLLAACDRDELRRDIRLSHPFTENDPRHKWAVFVAERLAERTRGEVVIRIFPNQQLFKGRQQYEGLRTNRIDLAIYPMPWLSGRVPAANIGALPGVISSLDDGLAWRKRRVWDLLAESVEYADVHMASILWVPATYAGRDYVPRLPDDLSGISMRGMGAPLETLLAAKGASITSMPAADTYFGLQTGSLDVLFSTVSSFLGYSMQEVVKEIVVGRSFLAGGHFVLMSRGLRQRLSEENLAVLDDVMAEGERYFAMLAKAEMEKMAARFEEEGVRLVELSDDEFDAWMDAAQVYSWPYYRETVPNGEEILAAIAEPR